MHTAPNKKEGQVAQWPRQRRKVGGSKENYKEGETVNSNKWTFQI